MSTTSYNRLRAGIIQDTHTISAPVVPVAIDLADTPRKTGSKAAQAPGRRTAPDVTGDAGSELIKSAQASFQAKQARKAQKKRDQEQQQQRGQNASNDPATAHRDATLQSFTDLAEQTSAQGRQRHGVGFPVNSKYNGAGGVAASTARTRWDGGPRGCFTEPSGSPFGGMPETLGTAGGAFSGV